MKILLIQPHPIRIELGGGRSPTNRSGTIYNILREGLHNVTIGTSLVKKDAHLVKNAILINEDTKYNYDRIILLSGTFGYCFPPNEPFDDKKRCIHALLNTDCPVIFVQDEYITPFAGYPADISNAKKLRSPFNSYDTHKGRDIKVLMQTKYPITLAKSIKDSMNKYDELKYQFINWGVQKFAFKSLLMMKQNFDTENILTYIGVMRPKRARLNLINNKHTTVYGRWKYPMDKVNQMGKVKVTDVQQILNKSNATIWTHDSNFIGMSVESARLYEATRSGCPLLVDSIMWKNKEDCYLYGSDCFYENKKELWEKVAKLYKDKNYRKHFIEEQQELYINNVRTRDEISKFLLYI